MKKHPPTKCAYKKCTKMVAHKIGERNPRKYCNERCRQKHYYLQDHKKILAIRHKYYMKLQERRASFTYAEKVAYEALRLEKNREYYAIHQDALKDRAAKYYALNRKKILAKMKAKRKQLNG